MKSVAFNLLGNRADAEDAVQEAFCRAYRNRTLFRGQSSLWTWVYRILLNTCHDMARRRSIRGAQSTDDSGYAEPMADVPDTVVGFSLRRAMAGLSPIYRDVFLLCDVEGHTHREVAEILEIAEGTSKARLSEARRQLRTMIGEPRIRQDAEE